MNRLVGIRGAALILATATFSNVSVAQVAVVNRGISEAEVTASQLAWCNALLDIGAVNDREGAAAAKTLASKVIDQAYGYQLGAVLFKPTLTVNPQTFRTTKAGALAYFVGGDPDFPKDKGFALKGWTRCEVVNAAILLDGDSATTMGKVHFTAKGGKVTTVDKTWKFIKDDEGRLRIVVHHSSLENTGG